MQTGTRQADIPFSKMFFKHTVQNLGGVHTSSARPDLLVFQPSRGRSHWLGSAQKLVETSKSSQPPPPPWLTSDKTHDDCWASIAPFCINRLLEFVVLSFFWPEEGSKQ
eukprot:1158982-Pelagomonas_calceolata.AAC.1